MRMYYEEEQWKDIIGFEGYYKVSSFGKIKRLKQNAKQGSGNYERKEYIIKQRNANNGYLMVDLYKDGIRKQFLVHRLVAMAFLENYNNEKYINHKDENKHNNNVLNLEWCSSSYNANYGTHPKKISDANSVQIIAIDKYGNKLYFNSAMDAHRKLGVSTGNISECLHHKRNRKTVGGYVWKFVQ